MVANEEESKSSNVSWEGGQSISTAFASINLESEGQETRDKKPHWRDLWLVNSQMKDVDSNENVYPNASVFNRKIYTMGKDKEVYVKFSQINSSIESYDELAYYDTRSCVLRVSKNEYILTAAVEQPNKICVLGVLSERYITNNNFNRYRAKIHDANDYVITRVEELPTWGKITCEQLIDFASRRIEGSFDIFLNNIRYGKSYRPLKTIH